MFSSTNFWMIFSGLICLAAGGLTYRREVAMSRGFDKLILLGVVFTGAPLAVFSPEHFRGPEFVAGSVPAWMPWHIFWVYLVGCALLGAAISLCLNRYVRLSSALLGLMLFLFVCMVHIPNVVNSPADRLVWTVMLRDVTFAAGAWALTAERTRAQWPRQSSLIITLGRMVMAVAVVFFGIQYVLHSGSAPGIPLAKQTPSWVPLPNVLGFSTAAVLIVSGLLLAINKRTRLAALSIGVLASAATLFIYLPILVIARNGSTPEISEGLNYVADTLLFAGAALSMASALPGQS